jgi:hypothetical protein
LAALSLGAVGCGDDKRGGSGLGEGGAGGEGAAGSADGVTVSIADVEVEEGDAGATELQFTVKLSRASDSVVRVPWETQDGTALAEGDPAQGRADYDETSATLRFEPGETELTLEVSVNGDALNEEDETFVVLLKEPMGAELADGEAEARIINDDELPVVSMESTTVTELDSGTQFLQLAVTLSAPVGRASSVDWEAVDDTAEAGDDYVAAMGAAVFAPGETSKTIQVVLLGDPVDEPDERFDIELSNPINIQLDEALGTVTILDNDSPGPAEPALSVSNATMDEGAVGSSTLLFTISLSQAAADSVTVNYATIDGTATAGGVAATGGRDYVAVSDSVTFLPGETSKEIGVTVNADMLHEITETFTILINAVGVVVLDAQGIGTITNDDAGPTISVGNVVVTEGAAGVRTATFVVSLSQASGSTVSVDFTTNEGLADAGVDYTLSAGTLSLDPGQTSGLVLVDIHGDLLNEGNETFYLDLSNAVNASILDSQALGTISNDDPLPAITIENVAVNEGDAGTTNALFNVSLSAASGQVVSVSWITTAGTAVASDFTLGSGILTLPAGATQSTISIPILGDLTDEPNETFTVDLYSAFNATLADGQGVGTILTDDSALPVLNILDANVAEGDAGTSTLSLTVTLDTPSAQPVQVNFASANGTATTAGADYQARSGTLSFDPGETMQTIDITINGDTLHERDETVLITLSGAVNALVADGNGVGTINNNDTPPTLSIDDVTLTEDNSGTKNATFTITLSAASGVPVTVAYATADGTAEEAGLAALGQDDYDAASQAVVIAAAATSVQVNVPVKGDTLAEADETFLVELSSPQNATIADGQGQGTITNDDLPTISIDDVSLREGDAGTKTFTFTVTLSGVSGSTVSVSFATANGTASSPADYTATSGSVSFAAGVTTATIGVTVVGENAAEANADETFFVNLSSPVGAIITDSQGLGTILSDD